MPEPQRRRELEAALRRFYDLAPRDQLVAYQAMRDYLGEGAPETEADREIRERAESLEALAKVAKKLGLADGEAPTAGSFNKHAPEIAPGWNAPRIQRLWGRWRFAVDAYEGRRVQPTAHQRALLRIHGGRRGSHEEPLGALRLWLADEPALVTTKQYDLWRAEFNDDLPEGELPLPRWTSIGRRLGLGFDEALEVARGGLTYDKAKRLHAARVRRARHEQASAKPPPARRRRRPVHLRRQWTRTEHEFVSIDWIAKKLRVKPTQASYIAGRRHFPTHVATFSGTRAWLRDDLEAHFAGGPVPPRRPNELQHLYLSAGEVAAMIDRPLGSLTDTEAVTPEPAGSVSSRYFYLRSEVEQWMRDNPQHLGRNLRRGSSKNRTTATGSR